MLSFEEQVNRLDPGWDGKCAALNVWKKAEIEKLMNHELFRDLVSNGEMTRTDWEKVSRIKSTQYQVTHAIDRYSSGSLPIISTTQ